MKKIKYKIKKLEVHADKRGWLVNLLKSDELEKPVKQLHISSILPNHIRGNHYHSKRIEWFFVVAGRAKLCLRGKGGGKKVCLRLKEDDPRVITIFPYTAHAVKNIGRETVYLVSAQSDIYNPKSPDAFPAELIRPVV